MAELKLRPVGDKPERLRKINRKISKPLNQDQAIKNIISKPMIDVIRMIYLILLIPCVLVAGITSGLCAGFQKSLEISLKLYSKALRDRSWYK
jgi:hypothetical protein